MGKNNSNNYSFDNYEDEKRTSPIDWSMRAERKKDGYKVIINYTLYDLRSKKVNSLVKRGKAELNFTLNFLEVEARTKDIEQKIKGRFGLPPLYGDYSHEAEELRSILSKKMRKEFDFLGLEAVEEKFLSDERLRKEAILKAVEKRLYDEKDGLEDIKRGEDQIDKYVGCVCYYA